MCRLLAYYGDPILLASSVLWPERSIIKQSYDARERLLDPSLPAHLGHGNLNADGFGIGWYSSDEHCAQGSKNGNSQKDDTPCTFKAITPAWNNDNLMKLASKIRSRLMFAHVRAAYPGMPVSEQNCHPFASGRYMFMHNGIIAGFSAIRRKLLDGLSDSAYDAVPSFHSDSAVSFALFLSFLPDMDRPQPPDVILQALQRTLQFIGEKHAEAGLSGSQGHTSLLNFVVTDGNTLIATCCVSPESDKPASLYYAEGTTFRRADGLVQEGDAPYSIDYANRSARVVIVASEPITGSASEWVAVPRNHGLVVTRDGDGYMNVLHVPLALASPSPRMEAVVRCLRTLPLASESPAERQSLLTRHMRRMAMTCGAVQQHGTTCSHCGRHMPADGRPRSTSSTHSQAPGGTPPRVSPLAAMSRAMASTPEADVSGAGAAAASLLQRGGMAAPGLDSINLANSPALDAALLERPAAAEGSGSPRGTFDFTAGADMHLLTGHKGAILNLVQDCDGLLYSCSSDKTVKVWNLRTLECVNTWAGHTKAILKLQLQGNYIFSIGGPSVRIWHKETGACVHRILTSRRAGWIRAISVTPDMDVVAGCQDTTLKVYRFSPQEAVPPPWGLQSMVSCPRGRDYPPEFAAAQECGAARCGSDAHAPPATLIAPVATGDTGGMSKARATFDVSYDAPNVTEALLEGKLDDGHCAAIHAVVSSRRFVCSAGGDSTIRVWRAKDLQPVTSMIGHRGPVFALLMLGDLLLSGGRDATIRVWDLDTCCCRRTLPGHTADVLNMSALAPGFSWNGNAADCGAADAVPAPDASGASPGRAAGLRATLDSTDSIPAHGGALILASCSADGTCRLWDVRTWTCVHVFIPGTGKEVDPVLCSAITETHLTLGMPSGELHVYEIGGILDGMMTFQAQAVDTLTKTWRGPEDEVTVEAVELGSDALLPAQRSRDKPIGRSLTWRRPHQVKENVQLRIEQQLLASLAHFVGIRTVSGDPHLHEDVFAGAKYLAGLLESVGMQVKLAQNVNTVHPCVLARLEVCPNLPTVVFYGHYDVFYVGDDNWVTNPFHMTSKDGYLYGRGTSDNKGPILAMVFAVKELLDSHEGEACAGLPCNLSFVFEGEEEIGSPGLAAVVDSHPSWFTDARLIVISNSQWIGDELPCLTLGMRGMLCMTVRVDGGTRDLHSGNDGGVFNEPMVDLVRVMASLLDSQHNILVPGFYDDVDPQLLEPILEVILEGGGQDFSVEAYAASLGVPALTCGSTLREVLTARWCQPSMTIADVRSSTTDESSRRFGPTRFSVVPYFVTGHISIRYVPNQSAEVLISHLTRHVQHEFRKLRSANRLQVSVRSRGQCWSAAPESRYFRHAAAAIEAEWGRKPLPVREGGTMPCASMLESLLGAPAIMIPMGQNSDNCHLANERLRRVNLIKGKNVIRRIIEGFESGEKAT